MVEDYNSIMRNDVCYIVLRPEGNAVVYSIVLYKIKHFAYGTIENFKVRFVVRWFS
jgi:hypothetical protein